jgi:hypothetical protein
MNLEAPDKKIRFPTFDIGESDLLGAHTLLFVGRKNSYSIFFFLYILAG